MYAKHYLDLDIPVSNENIGYDLFAGDWIEPYGNGLDTNIIMNFSYEIHDKYNYQWKLNIEMNSENAGFVCMTNIFYHSVAKNAFIAPVSGYSNRIIYEIKYHNGKKDEIDSSEPISDSFFFKIRNGTNNVNYGKLVNFEPHISKDGGYINFTYYLNPTPNDRNLELNTKSNLFQNLDRGKKVSKP